MAPKNILTVASYNAAARCWIQVKPAGKLSMANRFFSSKQRTVNFNTENETNIISNDTIFHLTTTEVSKAKEHEEFEPIIFGSDDVYTVGPVTKA